MKKLIALLLVLVMTMSFVGCAGGNNETEATEATQATEATEIAPEVMTWAEYDAAELDSAVVVECYVQAHQSWWDNKVTVYAQDADGAYFIYELACSEEDAAKLVPGAKIRVSGYKGEWSGEVEIMDGTFEFVEGDTFVAEALDVTELLGTEELIQHQNKFVAFKGMTVAPSTDAEGNDVAFLYSWDGSGEPGNSDLYFNVSLGENTYNFCVEMYLTGADTDVYKAVEALEIGQTIDMEGFLYWYNGINPHITSVTVVE